MEEFKKIREAVKKKWIEEGIIDVSKPVMNNPENIAKLYEALDKSTNEFSLLSTTLNTLSPKEYNTDITRLVLFDLDGTLVRTAEPETGKEIWEKATGTKWPHIGWWSKKESLDINIFPNEIIQETFEAWERERLNDKALIVLMTGRLAALTEEVDLVLEKHKLEFHKKYLNTGGDTISFKINRLNNLLAEHPNITEVEIFEDRIEHVEKFKEWGDSIAQEVKINLIVT